METRVERLSVEGRRYLVVSRPLPQTHTLLSPAEQKVIAFYCNGQTLQQIARSRGCSERTVANQVQSAYRKLGVSTRAELVRKLARPRAGNRLTWTT